MVIELIDAGESVVVIDNLSTGFRWAIDSRAKFYFGDVGSISLIEHIFQYNDIEVVIHFAGSVVIPESIINPIKYYKNNAIHSFNLMFACAKHGISNIIFSSTAAVYAPSPCFQRLDETAELNPQSPYGSSKLMAEKMLSDIATAAGINFIIFRYFNVAGADLQIRAGQSTIGATHLIKVAAEVAAGKRSKIAVYGTNYATHDGSCVRDFIHVTDLVLAHLRAINFMRNSQAKFILNLGYGHGYSVLQVLDALHTLTSVPFDVEFQARRPGDVPYVVANSNRAVEKLDWQPKLDDLNAILKSALNWEIARNNANTANST